MTEQPLSKTKIVSFMKSMKIDTGIADNDQRYLYGIGRNTTVDIMLAGIMCGDFDEAKPEVKQVPKSQPDVGDLFPQKVTPVRQG
jgi:hypothetical protein